MKGYNEMLKRIEPERIICYNTPFPEMEGNIVYVDYELSSWKYQPKDYDTRQDLLSERKGDIINKIGYVLPDTSEKGMGSAEGGKWKPAKEDDERFIGTPGEIKETIAPNGLRRLTKIGEDGFAVRERHFSVHNSPEKHSNPHDHIFDWSKGWPDMRRRVNYFDSDVPEFKGFTKECKSMTEYINNSLNFESISDYKWSMRCGTEVVFEWKGQKYCFFANMEREPGGKDMQVICEADTEANEMWCDTYDDLLEYRLCDGSRLRDVITQVTVLERTI